MNQKKRFNKINKQLSYLSSNHNFEKVRDLYMSGEVKSIPSAEKLINSIKFKKSGEVFKASEKKQNKLDNIYDKFSFTKSKVKVTKFKFSGRYKDYVHQVPISMQLDLLPDNLDLIKDQLLKIVNLHKNIKNNKVQLAIIDDEKGHIISCSFQKDLKTAFDRLMHDQIGPKSRDYDGQFLITSYRVSYFKPNQNIMGASNPRSIEQATKKWFIVNPISKSQCVFHAVACCRNYKKNKALLDPSLGRLKMSAKELKDCVKPTRNNYADNETIQEICEYVKQPINLYNNLFQVIKTFTPAIIKLAKVEYNIQRNNNHCLALIPVKELIEVYPDFTIEKIIKKVSDENNEESPIEKRKYHHKYNKKIGSWDIETTKNEKMEHIPYACSIAWLKKNKLTEKQFWGLDCLNNLITFIHSKPKTFSDMTLYAHNGGKYDLPLLIRNGLLDNKDFQIEGDKCLELNNAWIGFTIRSKTIDKFNVFFRDSFRLLPMSLEKLCKELNVEHKKLTETVKHDEISLVNYMTFPQLPLYLTHDVFGLLEVMLKFGRGVFNDLGIDITKCFTGASLSKINFFKNYYNSIYSVYSLSDSNDKFIRDGYFGGRVEVFKMGLTKAPKNYYYDFTSLYPDVGRGYLPYGLPIKMTFNNAVKIDKDFFGFCRCLCKTKDLNAIPKHAVIKDSRLVFPIFNDYTEIKIFSPEIDYDIYDYKFIDGLKFKKANFKAKFFNDGFNKKAEAKAMDNPAMSQAYKIIINSGYGFWGLRTQDRDGVIISTSENPTYMKFLHSDKLINIMEHGDYTFSRVLKDLEVKDFNVGVAASISSYARLKLHKLLTSIRKAGGEIYYCDTDSVICNINLNDYPEIKKQFQWDGNGVELGSLKNEADDYMEKLVNKKIELKYKEFTDVIDLPNEQKEEIKKSALKRHEEDPKDEDYKDEIGGLLSYFEEVKEIIVDKKLIKSVKAYWDLCLKMVNDYTKLYNQLLEDENGNFFWDSCIITGCKQYALQKKIKINGVEEVIEIVKLKGYSQNDKKLKFLDMAKLSQGEETTQEQTQFRCPKSNYVSETDSFKITTKKVTKKFKAVYTKGVVDGEKVTPLIIN